MAICRLCTKSCVKNDRLEDRVFREKVLDIICMWVDIEAAALPKDVCESCSNRVEEFYTYKNNCRLFQKAFTDGTLVISEGDVIYTTRSRRVIQKTSNILEKPVSRPATRKRIRVKQTKEEVRTERKKPRISRKGIKQKPRLDANGERLVVPRPWRRKFKEAVNLPPEEYRQYALENSTVKKYTAVCELCGRTVDVCRMDGHRNRHLGLEPYQCETCGDKFNCKLNLRGHIRRNHAVGEQSTCEICSKEFLSKLALRSHIRGVHGERKFQCTLCPQKCPSKYALNYHLRIHNQTRDYKCTLCPKAFYCKSVWNIHMRTHSGETPYKCDVCSMAYVHRNMYVAHMQKNHPGTPLMYLDQKRALKEALMKKMM